jgi:dynein heavy chain, axonemal
LTRLSAYVAGYDVFSITLTRGYKEKEFREDLKILYEKLCTKETLFLFTDSHVAYEGIYNNIFLFNVRIIIIL